MATKSLDCFPFVGNADADGIEDDDARECEQCGAEIHFEAVVLDAVLKIENRSQLPDRFLCVNCAWPLIEIVLSDGGAMLSSQDAINEAVELIEKHKRERCERN